MCDERLQAEGFAELPWELQFEERMLRAVADREVVERVAVFCAESDAEPVCDRLVERGDGACEVSFAFGVVQVFQRQAERSGRVRKMPGEFVRPVCRRIGYFEIVEERVGQSGREMIAELDIEADVKVDLVVISVGPCAVLGSGPDGEFFADRFPEREVGVVELGSQIVAIEHIARFIAERDCGADVVPSAFAGKLRRDRIIGRGLCSGGEQEKSSEDFLHERSFCA